MDFAATSGMVAVPAAAARKRGRTAEMRWTVDSASSSQDMGMCCKVRETDWWGLRIWKIMWIQTILTQWQRKSMFFARYRRIINQPITLTDLVSGSIQAGVGVWSLCTFPRTYFKNHFSVDSESLAIHPAQQQQFWFDGVWAHIQTWLLWKKNIMKLHVSMPAAYGAGVRTKRIYNVSKASCLFASSTHSPKIHSGVIEKPALFSASQWICKSATRNTKRQNKISWDNKGLNSQFTHADLCAAFCSKMCFGMFFHHLIFVCACRCAGIGTTNL